MKRILVTTDFSDEADRALTVAVRFAKLAGARIDLVHVYPMAPTGIMSPVPGAVPMPPPGSEILQGIQQRLDTLAGLVRHADVECLTTILEGPAPDEIVAHAEKTGADLIVTGTHGRTGVRKVLLGSVAEQILHKAHCPVLVVPRPR